MYGDDRGTEVGYVQVPKKNENLRKCYFQASPSGVVREIRSEQVVAFGFRNGDVYHTLVSANDDSTGSFFAKVVISGKLVLYSDAEDLILKTGEWDPCCSDRIKLP